MGGAGIGQALRQTESRPLSPIRGLKLESASGK